MLRRWIPKIGKRVPFPALAPETTFSTIGDIHGRVDLLEKALRIPRPHPVICVGDYVDRGDNSAEVIALLHERPDIICLSGNHEEMMLNFIDAPKLHGRRWLRYGGLQTLASFGVAGVTGTSNESDMTDARDHLVNIMGQPLIQWLKSLPRRWQSGNVAVVHAGADPAVPIDAQSMETLHWGHPNFAKTQRSDGIWVVHGHTIVDQPVVNDGRISIDTGAYATGNLTVARVGEASVEFDVIN